MNKSDIESVADEVLKDALIELQNTGRTADKILKAKLIRQESRHALDKIRELDEEEEEEEGEEEGEDLQDKITNALLNKFLGNSAAQNNQNNFDNSKLSEIANKLSPEDLQTLKEKFL